MELGFCKYKKAIFFSADALIALIIIFGVLVMIVPLVNLSIQKSEVHSDILETLSELKVGEASSSYVQSLIASGAITNTNNTLLEQIGEFYITNQSLAKSFTQDILGNLVLPENIGIWYGSETSNPVLIYSKNSTPYDNSTSVDVARQTISGLNPENGSANGFSARAFLKNSFRTNYYYLGGYVGDGNISLRVEYFGNISSAEIEIATIKNFDLYINGNFEGHYLGGADDFTPVGYNLSTNYFNSGVNKIELKGDSFYVAGGFVKIVYNSEANFSDSKKHYLPGIAGLINLYDGVYFGDNLTQMNVFLHMNTSQSVFLNLGNVTIFNGSTNDEENILVDNAAIVSKGVNYSDFEGKNVPLRLGFENVEYLSNDTFYSDVFSVTDLSGSMGSCAQYNNPLVCQYNCVFGGPKSCKVSSPLECAKNVCGGTCIIPYFYIFSCNATKLDLAKDANDIFIDVVLNSTGNRVGLQGYASTASSSDYHPLSTNTFSLKGEVDGWHAVGWTCICCGINAAVADLVANGNSNSSHSIVVMTDGHATTQCAQQGTGTSNGDAIQSACDAYDNYNITVHTVGFGTDIDNATLISMALCGHGGYYSASVDDLVTVYKTIANDIIRGVYSEQTLSVVGGFFSKLYSDSYVSYVSDLETTPFGLIGSIEKNFSDLSSGSFDLPTGSNIVKAEVSSYSGARWTDFVNVNDDEVYNISKYNSDYVNIGDPYIFRLPNQYIKNGSNNVSVSTGVSIENSTGGSVSNKIIYTVVKNVSAFSPIVGFADGCTWHILFEDNTALDVGLPDGSGNDCYFNEIAENPAGGQVFNDAFQIAVYNLLKELDFNSNGKVDVIFDDKSLQISLNELVGIPFVYETEVQVRIWK